VGGKTNAHSNDSKAHMDREMTRLFGELSMTVARLLGNEEAMEKSPDVVAAYFDLVDQVKWFTFFKAVH
jgi:hypothetical protein